MHNMKDVSRLELNNMTNDKMFSRNIPSKPLQPYFNVAPVCTKYSVLPILDVRKRNFEPLISHPNYDLLNTFNPGSRQAPWSGYASNVNDESVLRNQIYALQHSSQATYVPSSNSELYNTSNLVNVNAELPQFSLLFKEEHFNPTANLNVKTHDKTHVFFSNHTRQQLNNYDPPLPANLKNVQNSTK